MEDDQTGSLWSQITGECIKGEMQGKKLTLFPSGMTIFKSALEIPGIEFLKKPERGGDKSVYEKYFVDNNKIGIFGNTFDDSTFASKDIIYGLQSSTARLAVKSEYLNEKRVIIATLGDQKIMLIGGEDNTVAGYKIPDHLKDLAVSFPDRNTTILQTGDENFGELKFDRIIQVSGKKLDSHPVITAFWFAWKSFFPSTDVYTP